MFVPVEHLDFKFLPGVYLGVIVYVMFSVCKPDACSQAIAELIAGRERENMQIYSKTSFSSNKQIDNKLAMMI